MSTIAPPAPPRPAPPPPPPEIPPSPPEPAPAAGRVQRFVTAVIVLAPLVALAVGVSHLWGHGISVRDLVLSAVFYCLTGLGVSAGYHRLFAHRGYRAARPAKIALALAGSLAFEGGVIGWA